MQADVRRNEKWNHLEEMKSREEKERKKLKMARKWEKNMRATHSVEYNGDYWGEKTWKKVLGETMLELPRKSSKEKKKDECRGDNTKLKKSRLYCFGERKVLI